MATQVNYTTEHKGTLFPSILNIPGGAVFADQINWGDNSNFAGTAFTTTSALLTAIDSKIQDAKDNGGLKEDAVKELVTAYYAEAALTDEQIGEKISSYITANGVIPSISKGTSEITDVDSTYYISDFTVSGHTITPVYTKLTEYTHPAAKDLWGDYENDGNDGYYESDIEYEE